jgi:hypothetical protein
MTHQIGKGRLVPLGRGIALCALLTLGGAAYAQTVVLSAAANSNLTGITINGRALQPVSGSPQVSLGSHVLSVVSFNNTQISASLPPGLKPGSYDLAVTAIGAANFDLTIGGRVPRVQQVRRARQAPRALRGLLSVCHSAAALLPMFRPSPSATRAGRQLVRWATAGTALRSQGAYQGALP